MSKIIQFDTRAEYQPPQPARRVGMTIVLPMGDDHYLFPGLMKAYVVWDIYKDDIARAAWGRADKLMDAYYSASTKALIAIDHAVRMAKWYGLPRAMRVARRVGNILARGVGKLSNPAIKAWEWREDLYRD